MDEFALESYEISHTSEVRRKLDNHFLGEINQFSRLLFEINESISQGELFRTKDIEEEYRMMLYRHLDGKKRILDEFKQHDLDGLSDVEKIKLIAQLIGNTPIVRLPAPLNPTQSEIYLKLEYLNPLSNSLKDRPAVEISIGLIERDELKNRRPMDASSGRFAVALSLIGYLLGCPAHVVVSDRVSYGTKLMSGFIGEMFDAEIEEVPDVGICPALPTDGAIAVARSLATSPATRGMYSYTKQFQNENNPKSHRRTGEEILIQMGAIDTVVVGGGSGGTFGGVGSRVQEVYPDVKVVLVLPQKNHHQYGLRNVYEAWKPTIWENYERRIKHEEMIVNDETAYKLVLELNRAGVYSGISGASVVAATLQEAIGENRRIVGIIPDSIEKYPMDFASFLIDKNQR